MKIQIALVFVLLSLTSLNCQFLGNNRFDYRNTSNQHFSDLVEFTVCGFNSTSLTDFAAALSQSYLNVNREGWQKNVKMLFGDLWKNGSKFFLGCQNPNQQLQQFAVRAQFIKNVLREFNAARFRQHISCVDEIMMRQYLSDNFGQSNVSRRLDIGPKLVRMVFHDALDNNNLIDANNVTYQGRAGVDFCLYSPQSSNASKLSDSDADPDHNRGLGPSLWFVNSNQRLLSPWVETPDVQVLGAMVALEDWFKGPKVNFRFGRLQGQCQKVLCILENCVNQTLFLKNSPSSANWNPKQNLDIITAQGLSKKEAIALIGAHTIGGVNVCTGFSNLNTGAFCRNVSSSGQLDSGSFFDLTPQRFDNNYFQMLANITDESRRQLQDCGFLQGISSKSPSMFFNNICPVNQYCNQTNGRKSHIKNLQNISFGQDGKYRRIVQLPSDWSNLYNDETLRYIREFANNQTEFFNTFADAYEQVSNLGYSNEELNFCSAVQCSYNATSQSFSCQSTFDDFLNFQANTTPECQVSQSDSQCELIGGYGTAGIIQCSINQYTCPQQKSTQNNLTMIKFLAQSQMW